MSEMTSYSIGCLEYPECLSVFTSLILLNLIPVFASALPPLSSPGSDIKEYCQWETFNASCPAPDHVIVMMSARYGRMAESRCADKKYGFIGCAIDVLPLADSRCSGRPSCRITIADLSLQGVQPCPTDLTSYFQASYRCVRVEMPVDQPCSPVRFTKLTSLSGFLSSVSPIQRFGSNAATAGRPCRWLIEAESGRRLNLTMYDFSMTSSAVAMTKATCRRLAVVRDADSGRETNVCSGHERIRQAHVSDGNRVEITMTASSPAGFGSNTNLGPAYFLVHYEVTGCSRKNLPSFPGSTIEMSADGETALIECDVRNHMRWLIKCINSQWHIDGGDIGNCSTVDVDFDDTADGGHMWPGILSSGWTSPYGVVAVISLGVLFGLIIGSSLLGVAVCLLKWKRRSVTNRRLPGVVDRLEQAFNENEEDYMPGCHVISDTGHKRTCECGVLWSQPDRYGLAMLHHHQQQHQLQQHHHDSETLPATKTYASYNANDDLVVGGVRRLSMMATPDLFVNTTQLSPAPEIMYPDEDNTQSVVGRMVAERQFHASPIISHHRGLLD